MIGGGLEPGTVVGDRYRLDRYLGEGGMGWVWAATDASTDKPVALKLLKSHKDEDRKRFQREVRAAAAIRHPNVIAVHELVVLADGRLVIVMDLLAGETLCAVLRRDGRLSLGDLVGVFLPVLAALEAAHALGIVHRDLKPDNVFLCRTASASGANVDVKVLDFGVAKLTSEEGLAARTQALTGTGSMIGTPYYMSPEQVFADKSLDSRADIWSLGIVMYECLTGQRPTEADTVGRVLKKIMVADFELVTAHCADLPEDVATLIRRMLSVDREDRPRDVAEVRAVLERHISAEFPSFSRARSVPPIDPDAPTITSHGEERRKRASEGPEPAPPATDEVVARTDTSRGFSISQTESARSRTRLVAVGAVVVLALLGVGMSLRGRDRADGKTPVGTTSATPLTTNELLPSAMPSTPEQPRGRDEAAAPAAPPALPAPSAPPAPASAGSVMHASLPVAPSAAITKTMAPVPVVSKPQCESGEVLSEGHCCPRGHHWRAGRCERPLATSF